MADSHSGGGRQGRDPQPRHSTARSTTIGRLLDAVVAGQPQRLEELAREHPQLREEFAGLCEGHAEVQAALRGHADSLGQEVQRIQRELEQLGPPAMPGQGDHDHIGELTELTRYWARPEVVDFYRAFANSIVSILANETAQALSPQHIVDDAEYLCSQEGISHIRLASAGRHVRDVLIEVLAERWNDRQLVHTLTRERFEALLKDNDVLRQHLGTWTAFVAA